MDLDRHILSLEADGDLLASAAEQAGLTTNVPSCPAWQVRDLLRHQGYVHRWATSYVSVPIQAEAPELTEAEQLAGGPPDERLLAWFREGHRALVRALRTAEPDVVSWTFMPAASPLGFWARRQAHETAIHRADAQLAAGQAPGHEPDFAADGVDELIMSFFARRADPDREQAPERTLLIRAAAPAGSGGPSSAQTGSRWRRSAGVTGRPPPRWTGLRRACTCCCGTGATRTPPGSA